MCATLIGYLQKMASRYKTITILAQGASIASLMGLLMADMKLFSNNNIRFFDLGRIMDVVNPEIIKKQGWLGGCHDDYMMEGLKIFNLNSRVDYMFASKL